MATTKELRALITLAGKVDPSLQLALTRAAGQTQKLAQTAEKSASRLNKVSASAKSLILGQAAALAGTLAAVIGVQKIVEVADAWTTVRSRVSLVTDSVQQQQESLNKLYEISQKTRQSYEATGDLYAKVAMNAKQLGLANDDVLKLTELVNKALIVGGGTTQQNEAAIMQFSQALASGRLQGDELRSILENAPYLAKAMATGLGVATGDLKQLGADGELTADIIIKALQSQSVAIDENFKKMPVTLRQSFTYASNAFGKFIDDTGKKTNIFSRIAGGIVKMTDKVFGGLNNLGENKGFQELMQYVQPFIPILQQVGKGIMDIIKTVWDVVGPFLLLLFQKLQPILLQLGKAFIPILGKFSDTLKAISPVLKVVGKYIVYFFAGAFNALWPVIKNVLGILGGLLDFITGVFTGNWSKAWKGVKEIFSNIFKGLGNYLLLPISLMISQINAVIQSINGVKIPDWIPKYGGKALNIPLIPLPKFALGGIATQASIFAERGPEMAIPLQRTPRSLGLLSQATQILKGRSGDVTITYAPVIQGGTGPEVKQALAMSFEQFKTWIEQYFADKERVSFG